MNAEQIKEIQKLVDIATLISHRLTLESIEMGYAGMYDGNYLCAAFHPELDEAIKQVE